MSEEEEKGRVENIQLGKPGLLGELSPTQAICPRATIELRASAELLKAIRFAFQPEQQKEDTAHQSTTDNQVDAGFKPSQLTASQTERQFDEIENGDAPLLLEAVQNEVGSVLQSQTLSDTALQPELSVQSELADEYELPLQSSAPIQSSSTSQDDAFWSECENLYAKGLYEELSTFALTAPHLSKERFIVSASKLWWIRAQLELKSLSAALLTAPLQELLHAESESPLIVSREGAARDGARILGEVTGEVVQKSIEMELSPASVYKLVSLAGECLSRAGAAEYSLFREERAALVRVLESRDEFTLSRLERETLEILKAETPRQSVRPIGGAAPLQLLSPWTPPPSPDRLGGIREFLREVSARVPRPSGSHALSFLVAFIVGVVGFRFLLSSSNTADSQFNFHSALLNELPPLEFPRQLNLNASTFTGMLMDAGGKEYVSNSPGTIPVSQGGTNGAERRASLVNSTGKGVINTSTPVEPDSLRQEIESGENGLGLRPASPQDFVRSVGVDMIPDGRIGDLGKGSGRDRPLTVKEPSLYRIVVDTAVLEEPVLGSRVLQRLDRGQRVRVVERIGEWLMLSSHNAKPGYIPAQDAEEIGFNRS